MTRDEELLLVEKAAKGGEDAFEKLMLANQKGVYSLALRLTASPDDALDVSQDAFLKAYTNLSSFRGDSRLSVWLYRLTYNAAMDHMRKTRRQETVPLEPGEEGESIDLPDPRPQPEEDAERKETRREVWEAVRKLPRDKQEILIMREFSGMSYTRIAEALGLEEGTVKSRLARARLALAELLRKSGTFEKYETSKKQKGGRRDG